MRSPASRSVSQSSMRQRVAVSLIIVLAITLMAVFAMPSKAYAAKTETSILFIGNSLTYTKGYGVPNALESISNANGKRVHIEYVTFAGAYLSDYAYSAAGKPERRKALLAALKRRDWDYVVMQDFSKVVATVPMTRTYSATRTMASLIRRLQPNAQILLYATHGYNNGSALTINGASQVLTASAMQLRTQAAYDDIGCRLGLDVIPVGAYHYKLSRNYPEIKLLKSDRRHPTTAGYYLAASAVFEAIYGRPPTKTAKDIDDLAPQTQKKILSILGTEASMNPTHLGLAVGQTARIKANMDGGFRYAILNRDIATIDQNGQVRAIKPGSTVAYAESDTGMRATCLVSVEGKRLHDDKLKLPSKELVLEAGSRVDSGLSVSAALADYNLKWRTSKSAVAVVNGAGLVQGARFGMATITVHDAASGSVAKRRVRVCLPKPANVSARTETATGEQGQIIRVTWNKVPYAKGYAVYRSVGKAAFKLEGKTQRPSFVDKKVASGQTVRYRVVALSASGTYDSTPSKAASISTPRSPALSTKG